MGLAESLKDQDLRQSYRILTESLDELAVKARATA
jgi:hypothetical protein